MAGGRAMTAIDLGKFPLYAHIAFMRIKMSWGAIGVLILAGLVILMAAIANAPDKKSQANALAVAQKNLHQEDIHDAPVSEDEQGANKFYAVLGDRVEAEQYLKTMFDVAAQTGISLDQGEYQWGADKDSRTYRYQVLLPVKGSYSLIRQFSESTLRVLPFASLDELTFKRDSAGEDTLGANLRFTFYLGDKVEAVHPMGFVQ
jgi:hypothetical protein